MGWSIIVNASIPNIEGVKKAAIAGGRQLSSSKSPIDAVEAAIRSMEDNPVFDAGTGCDINLFGEIFMDASIMDGGTLRGGAVGAVRGVKNPISVARRVLEKTDYVLLVGEGAEEFARAISETDREIKVGYDARTDAKREKLEKALKLVQDESLLDRIQEETSARGMSRLLVDGDLERLQSNYKQITNSGTVSASATDGKGNFAAGASTGGWTFVVPGRIGDSPLIGCGAYADNQAGCASTAGIRGEENARLGGLTRMICDSMRRGETAQASVEVVEKYAKERLDINLKKGTLIAIDRNCNLGFNVEPKSSEIGIAFLKQGMRRPIYPF